MNDIRLDMLSGDDFLRLKQASEIMQIVSSNDSRITIANKQFVASVVNSLIAHAKANYEDNLAQEREGLDNEN